jgi:hypothetical protein
MEMAKGRTVATLIGLAVVGTLLGALAGVATAEAGIVAIAIRNGHMDWPFALFGAAFGAVVGGGLGALLAPAVAFTPWRYVPIGRLFGHLTLGTIIGGSAGALIFPSPVLALLGGIAGFLIAGNRVARRSNPTRTDEHKDESRASSA